LKELDSIREVVIDQRCGYIRSLCEPFHCEAGNAVRCDHFRAAIEQVLMPCLGTESDSFGFSVCHGFIVECL
jgi:hypothetical protein